MDGTIICYEEYKALTSVMGSFDPVKDFLGKVYDRLERMKTDYVYNDTITYRVEIEGSEATAYCFLYIDLDSRFRRFGLYTDPSDVNMPSGFGYYMQVYTGQDETFKCFYVDFTNEGLAFIDEYDKGFTL